MLAITAYGIVAIWRSNIKGSSMKKGLLIEEVLNKKWHKNLLYTAVTRAEEKLIILR